ncbi:MAG TPA: KEOPS complex subunit Pcc1 [Candidatus Methanoperedens sp.]
MKIKGKLIFISEDAGGLVKTIAKSLSPDNLPEMKTTIDRTSATVTFQADKISTILSSVDDYLMNAKIADDIICRTKKKPKDDIF